MLGPWWVEVREEIRERAVAQQSWTVGFSNSDGVAKGE